MNKLVKLYIGIVLIGTLLIYLCFSFCFMSFDPHTWGLEPRKFATILELGGIVLSALFVTGLSKNS